MKITLEFESESELEGWLQAKAEEAGKPSTPPTPKPEDQPKDKVPADPVASAAPASPTNGAEEPGPSKPKKAKGGRGKKREEPQYKLEDVKNALVAIREHTGETDTVRQILSQEANTDVIVSVPPERFKAVIEAAEAKLAELKSATGQGKSPAQVDPLAI